MFLSESMDIVQEKQYIKVNMDFEHYALVL